MMPQDIQREEWKQAAGDEAAKFVENGMLIGLGTGSTAQHFIRALARRVQQGLQLAGAVCSSQASQDLATQLGIPCTDLDTHPEPELYIDGADEIDSQLRLIKGAGGALLREKILATTSRRFIVIADITKQVRQLGEHAAIPIETVPFAITPVRKRLEALGALVHVRQLDEGPFITENNNIILDCAFPQGIADPLALDTQIQRIVGVVETGLFLHLATQAIIGGPDGVKVLNPQ